MNKNLSARNVACISFPGLFLMSLCHEALHTRCPQQGLGLRLPQQDSSTGSATSVQEAMAAHAAAQGTHTYRECLLWCALVVMFCFCVILEFLSLCST